LSDAATELNIKDILARIDRQQEETRKFVSEQHKLMAEANKFTAESAKLTRDRDLAPWQLLLAALGAGAAVFAAGGAFLKFIG